MINDNSGEEEPAKKSKRGRRSHQSISKKSMNVRLLNGDRIHIEKIVKELKHSDPNFATEGAAVRYYVGVGIAAEKSNAFAPENIFVNSVMKRVQNNAVLDQMKPLAYAIEDLMTHLIESSAENSRFYADITKRTEAIEAKIGDDGETILKLFTTIIESDQQSSINEEQVLRNLIVLRSIIFVYLFEFKAKGISFARINIHKWRKRIDVARRLANGLSTEEVKIFFDEMIESKTVRKLIREIIS